RRAAGEPCQARLEPGFQRRDQRLGFLLARRPALLGALAADLGFDLVDFGNPLEGLDGDRRRGGFGQVEELPAPVCPTEGERSSSSRISRHTGLISAAASPVQKASTDRSIVMPCRARIWAWRYSGQ